MASRPLVECSFLIPIHGDRDLSGGRKHTRRAWRWLHESLGQFGGGTRTTELFIGWYIDPDTHEQVEDLSRKYYVALPRREIRKLRSLLRTACGVFHQKCIYLSVAGQVELVQGAAHEEE